MGCKTYFCAVFVLLVAFLSYRLYNTFLFIVNDILFLTDDTIVNKINADECITYKGIIGAEDISRFDSFLIVSSDDRMKLFNISPGYNFSNTKNGALYLINPDTESFRKLKIFEYPEELAFHPHGLYVVNDNKGNELVYVINHAYSKGGERIEVMRKVMDHDGSFDNINLEYLYSIKLNENHTGILNDLTVINASEKEDEIYFTQNSPLPDPITGKEMSLFENLKHFFFSAYKIKNTYVYYCRGVNIDGYGNCSCVSGTDSMGNNGITYYKAKELIYVAKTFEKMIVTYKIDSNDHGILHKIKETELRYSPDNLDLNLENNSIDIGVFARGIDNLNLIQNYQKDGKVPYDFVFWGGALSTNLFTHKSTTILMQDRFYATSVAVRYKEKLVLGSWAADGFMVCYWHTDETSLLRPN